MKEVASYKVESDKQAAVVAKMEAANEDIYEIRQQVRLLPLGACSTGRRRMDFEGLSASLGAMGATLTLVVRE